MGPFPVDDFFSQNHLARYAPRIRFVWIDGLTDIDGLRCAPAELCRNASCASKPSRAASTAEPAGAAHAAAVTPSDQPESERKHQSPSHATTTV
jgi:hypothetical protein